MTKKKLFEGASQEEHDDRFEIKCPYCKQNAKWVENKEIYGNNIGKSYMAWLCRDCDAYVGCVNNSRKPLGFLANAATRRWRQLAHAMLDPVWKKKCLTREQTYDYISRKLGAPSHIHIGKADIETCKKVVHFCHTNEWFNEKLRGKKCSGNKVIK